MDREMMLTAVGGNDTSCNVYKRSRLIPSSRAVRSAARSRPGDDHNPILGDLMRDRIVPPTDGGATLKSGGSPREVLRYIEQAERLLRR